MQSKALINWHCGLFGSPVVLYFAVADVGTLGFDDEDRIYLSNLQRQVLSRNDDIGLAKVERSAVHIHQLNSDVSVQ